MGFGSMYFVHSYVRRFPHHRILLVEWGADRDHAWHLENQRNSDLDAGALYIGWHGEKP